MSFRGSGSGCKVVSFSPRKPLHVPFDANISDCHVLSLPQFRSRRMPAPGRIPKTHSSSSSSSSSSKITPHTDLPPLHPFLRLRRRLSGLSTPNNNPRHPCRRIPPSILALPPATHEGLLPRTRDSNMHPVHPRPRDMCDGGPKQQALNLKP